MEEPHVLQESISLLKNELGISFDMLAKKLGVHARLLADICGVDYEEVDEIEFDDVVVPFNF